MVKVIERQGGATVPMTTYYPQIRGGQCERHGVVDQNQPATEQYKLCGCFNGAWESAGDMLCSYCPATRNPVEVIRHSILNVHGHPTNPNQLVVVCDDLECSEKHQKRFQISA